jgi:dethiobiotin synthetase
LGAASFHVKQPSPAPLYGFGDPVTPALAARREGAQIDLAAVTHWVHDRSAGVSIGQLAASVIETAGGVFSPLGPKLSNFDLALGLEPATWVLVAPDRLGVLHEVIATLGAMAHLGRIPDWIVLSAPERADASTGHNLAELRVWGVAPRLLALGRGETDALAPLIEDLPQAPL